MGSCVYKLNIFMYMPRKSWRNVRYFLHLIVYFSFFTGLRSWGCWDRTLTEWEQNFARCSSFSYTSRLFHLQMINSSESVSPTSKNHRRNIYKQQICHFRWERNLLAPQKIVFFKKNYHFLILFTWVTIRKCIMV